jgi:hypothetical protein
MIDYGQARFILAISAITLATVLVLIDKIKAADWVQVMCATLALYALHSVLDDKLPDRANKAGVV